MDESDLEPSRPEGNEERDARRIDLRNTVGEIISKLRALAKARRWTSETLEKAYATLAQRREQDSSGNQLFPLSIESGTVGPRYIAGWARLTHAERLFKPSASISLVFQADHLRRLHLVMRHFGVLQQATPSSSELETLAARLDFAAHMLKLVMAYVEDSSNMRPDKATKPSRSNLLLKSEPPRQSVTLVLRDPRIAGDNEKRSTSPARGLSANMEIDTFREREEDLGFLDRFLNLKSKRLAWTLITGDSGAGKTRLALQFFQRFLPNTVHFGFLDRENYPRLQHWQPSQTTFLVIDYASRTASQISLLLRDIIESNYRSPFSYDVRILLLERTASSAWYDELVSPDTRGNSIAHHFYCEPKSARSFDLTPLSFDALVHIAQGRVVGKEIPDNLLREAICAIDPRQDLTESSSLSKPRPIYAAVIGLACADFDGLGKSHTGEFFRKEDILDNILERERQLMWRDQHALDAQSERRESRKYENLLLIATIAHGIARRDLIGSSAEACSLVPTVGEFDADRYERMAGSRPSSVIGGLAPEILGVYFVLSSLRRRDILDRPILVEAALAVAGYEQLWMFVRTATREFFDLFYEVSKLTALRASSISLFPKYSIASVWFEAAHLSKMLKRLDAELFNHGDIPDELDEWIASRGKLTTEDRFNGGISRSEFVDGKLRVWVRIGRMDNKIRKQQARLARRLLKSAIAVASLHFSKKAAIEAAVATEHCERCARDARSVLNHPFNRQYLDRIFIIIASIYIDMGEYRRAGHCLMQITMNKRDCSRSRKILRLIAYCYKVRCSCLFEKRNWTLKTNVRVCLSFLNNESIRRETVALLADMSRFLSSKGWHELANETNTALRNYRAASLLDIAPSEDTLADELKRVLYELDETYFP